MATAMPKNFLKISIENWLDSNQWMSFSQPSSHTPNPKRSTLLSTPIRSIKISSKFHLQRSRRSPLITPNHNISVQGIQQYLLHQGHFSVQSNLPKCVLGRWLNTSRGWFECQFRDRLWNSQPFRKYQNLQRLDCKKDLFLWASLELDRLMQSIQSLYFP